MTNPFVWQQGWWQNAHICPSSNCDARPLGAQVDLIVIHSISLPPGKYGGVYIQQLFTNQLNWDAHPYFDTIRGLRVSAHFVIDRDGNTTQYVSCKQRAWHAGTSCWRGRECCNDDSIGIELEGLDGQKFTSAQYKALQILACAIVQTYPIAYIAGHEHIAPMRKTDPGAGFDWQYFQKISKLPVDWFPDSVWVAKKA